MILIKRLRAATLAIAGVMCLMSGFATAQDLDETGVIRITDQPINLAGANQILPINCDNVFNDSGCADSCVPGSTNGCSTDQYGGLLGGCFNGTGNCSCPSCQNGNCQCQNGGGHCQNGVCQNGNCPHCSKNKWKHGCRYEYPGYGCGNKPCVLNWLGFCGPGAGCQPGCNGCGACNGRLSQSARRLLAWIDPCSTTCSYSPMHGFTPPTKQPYFRQPISYQHNYPAQWVGGTPSGYYGHRPAVYTPTDTTQLGYYYQKVPTWVPVPGMIPPAPQPAEWHQYAAANSAQAACKETAVEEAKPTEASGEADQMEEPEVVPPMPPKVEKLNLERTSASPRLLPILKPTN